MKPTLSQAKVRYNSHTRKVMTTEFRKECDAAKWGEEDGYPVLRTIDNRILLHFRSEGGLVFAAIGAPSGYKEPPVAWAGKGDR